MPHKYLIKEFEDYARTIANAESLMQHVSQRIHTHIPRYNWVGFYLVDKLDPGMLVLGPYAGSFTPNPKISFTQGICGAAASSGRTVIADNVAQDSRYLIASDLVKSQISAPLNQGNRTIGVFNVESYFMNTFRATQERDFVESCARIVVKCLESSTVHDLVHAMSR
jgi:GAF domain-containing protein